MSKKDPKKTDNNPTPEVPRDEALFDALGKNKKKKKRRLVWTIVSIVLVAAVFLVIVVGNLQRRVQAQFAAGQADVLRYEAATGTISTVVSGSGTLANEDTEIVTVPSGVTLGEVLVAYGDAVAEGQLIATVDMATVKTAMSDLQSQIADLDDQIGDAEGDKVSSYIQAGVSGRVKILYGEKGENVADVMVENGALAILSLDGYMAVDLETDQLALGDSVTVLREDGKEFAGKVDRLSGGTATILVTDNGPQNDEMVTVKTSEGEEIGSGVLYVHNPLAVTGYAGTISRVNVSENQKVYASSTVFTLTNTSSSANYDALLRSRSELEEQLLELLRIQRSGGMTAPISGSVYGVSETGSDIVTISPDVSMSVTIVVDESDILSLEEGQEADVTVSSVSDEAVTGSVSEIDKTGTTGYYTAVITVDKVAGMLPGMTASVDVRIEGVDNAIIIPIEALHQTSAGAYVYTTYDEETQTYGGKVDVVAGLSNSNYVEIKSGLQVGDTVYYTESLSIFDMFNNMGFGNNRGSGGNPSGGYSGEVPDMGGGERPDMGGSGGMNFGG